MENQAEMAGAAFGRGMAAMITTFFGFAWFGWGFSVLREIPTAVTVVYFSVGVALMAFAVRAVGRGRRIMKAQGAARSDFWEKRRKPFGIVTALEAVGCVIVVMLADVFHRPDLTAAGVSFMVGVHFLPLGRIFASVAFYWVGGVMVAWDILTVTALKSWNQTAVAAFATGVILWAAAFYLLTRSARVAPTSL
jgi:hypothetical protein